MRKRNTRMALPKKTRKKTQRKKFVSEFGNAPSNPLDTRDKLMRAYSWYNSSYEHKDAMKALRVYVKQNEQYAPIAKVSDSSIASFVGIQAKMLLDGLELPEDSMTWFRNKMDDLTLKGLDIKPKAVKVQTGPTEAEKKMSSYIAEIDGAIDNHATVDFSAHTFLKAANASHPALNALKTHYAPVLEEIVAAKAAKKADQDLVEAYSCYSTRELTKFVKFVQAIVDDIEMLVGGKKAERKPRKAAVKKASDVSKDIETMKENKDLKIVSINPTAVVGARVAYMYKANYNELWMLVSETEAGLSFKGKSLIGADATKSFYKKIGKDKIKLSDFVKNGKVATKRLFESFGGTPVAVTSRVAINDKVLLLKAFG